MPKVRTGLAPTPETDVLSGISRLDQQQRRILQKMAELFQVLGPEGAIDHSMIATHPNRHAMTDNDLIAIVNDRRIDNGADRQDKTLRWIDNCGKAVDAHAAEI